MKKVLIASGVAVLAFAMVAGAQGYSFSNNLTVGSTGADVVALQTMLISSGYNIPSIASGAAAKGYFGAQTKSAVMAYQAAHGIPNTGFVGPLTRAALNSGAVGMTPTTGTVVTCPVGYICQPVQGTTPVTGTPTGISTPGAVGTLAFSLWSTPSNGTTVYKGNSYDVATYKAQASASDMAVQNFSVDFDNRLWLYASAVTVKDETGAVVGQVNNLNQGNFTEITVGSDYRLNVPVSNLVIRATQTKYLTVNVTFLAISDRQAATLTITQAQVRSVDGTGVTDTETEATDRTFSYQGTNSGQLIVSVDSTSPKPGQVSISTSGQTQDVVLGVYSIKSTNQNATLRNLKLSIKTASTTISGNIGALFANIKVKSGSLVYTASTIATTTDFTGSNISIPLPADQYVPITVTGTVVQDTNNALDGITASTSIALSTTNVDAEDPTYNTISLSSSNTISTSDLTFTAAAASITNETFAIADPGTNSSGRLSNTLFTGAFTVVTGNTGVYLSVTPKTAFATTSNMGAASSSIDTFTPTDGTNGSDSSTFYFVGPNASRTFNIGGSMNNTGGTGTTKAFGVNKIYFTDDTNTAQKYNVSTNLQGLNSDLHLGVLLGTS